MIRSAIVHLMSEQPVVVDILEMPAPGDLALICRNVRTLDGRRPVFIDRSDATFVFPYASIRFVEMPKSSIGGGDADETPSEPGPEAPQEPEELEIDEEFLRKIRAV